ncbi:MAG: DUF4397 domain-containing protein [Bacteroidales bacterium]|nr:DUF4397 domain-containing protein [Bacteroidales bacterium]
MKNFTLIFVLIFFSCQLAISQTARVQVIHNSADAAADSVDLYLDDVLLIDNFAFRNASAFLDVTAGTPISIDIAPKTSTNSSQSIYNLTTTLTAGETYVLVASGIISASGYSPATAFDVDVFALGREASSSSGKTDLLVYHGSTDAPTVDVYEATGPANLVDGIAYKGFASDYIELANNDYYLQVRDETGTTNLFAYNAPLQTLQLEDSAAVVVASGFVDPSANSDGAEFGLFVALPSGGEMVALPKTTTRVQVIHNSADAAADSVDVYLNDKILIDKFAFRNASAFIDAPANTEISIDIAPKTSANSGESIYNLKATLDPMKTYVLVASGIVSASGYSPKKDFAIDIYDMAREKGLSGSKTDLLVYHGSTDAPTVDIYESTAPAELIDNLEYSKFAGYLELATQDYTIGVRDETGVNIVQKYSAPLSTLNLDGEAITVVASGFLTPGDNSNGPAFGLYVALAAGGELVKLPEDPSSIQRLEITNNGIYLYPVPAYDNITIDFSDLKATNIEINIISLTGSIIYKQKTYIDGGVMNIGLENLKPGLYFLQVNNEEFSQTIRFEKL